MEIFAIFNLVLFAFCFSILFIVSRIIENDWQLSECVFTQYSQCIHLVYKFELKLQFQFKFSHSIYVKFFRLLFRFVYSLSFCFSKLPMQSIFE